MSGKPNHDCPLQDSVGDIPKWVDEMKAMKSKKPNLIAWFAVMVTVLIFTSGVIFSSGKQSTEISDNSDDITEIHERLDRTDGSVMELKLAVIEFRIMANDVADIKQYLLKEATSDPR
jgi:hypothetical protein